MSLTTCIREVIPARPVGLLALGRRDPVRQQRLTIFGLIVLSLAVVRVVVIFV